MTKETPVDTLEIVIQRSYWPLGDVVATRGDDVVEVKSGDRLYPGDVVALPRKEASKLVNTGVAQLPEMD